MKGYCLVLKVLLLKHRYHTGIAKILKDSDGTLYLAFIANGGLIMLLEGHSYT